PAFMKTAEESNISYSDVVVDDFSSITGEGIKGIINGLFYYVGGAKLFKDLLGSGFNKKIDEIVTELQKKGNTGMSVVTENALLAVIAVADEVRESSKEVIQKLHQLRIENTIMLTGDNKATANAIGRHVGVSDLQAELMPHDKLDYIKQLRSKYG